jgi:hypothetical protein
MRRLKRVFVVLFLLVLVAQIPFAYRRYKLGRLNQAIQLINSSRKTAEIDARYREYLGVLHVHSFLGGHSTGTFSDIIAAAQANQLQFVLMTEHTEGEFDTADMTLKGVHSGVLFVNGNEVVLANDDRVLVVPGNPKTNNLVSKASARPDDSDRLVLVAYPERFKGWHEIGYDGIEVYNVFSNSSHFNPLVTFFDLLWSHRSYRELLFATVYKRPGENLAKWDQLLSTQRLSAVAGNDAHANIGLTLNDSSGKRLLGFQLDPYVTSFRLVKMHVLIPAEIAFDQANLLAAIRSGHCFIGFDVFGDTSGFRFAAVSASETKIQGDAVTLGPNLRLQVSSPVTSRILVLRNGSPLTDDNGVTFKEVEVHEKGVYRVEVYLPQLGSPVGEQPWIISNPIYVY